VSKVFDGLVKEIGWYKASDLERVYQYCKQRAAEEAAIQIERDEERHAEALEAALGPHGQG